MKGRNRAEPLTRVGYLLEKMMRIEHHEETPETPCVFISHQHEDTTACRPIADYLLEAGIDIYFDQYDTSLSQLVQQGDANKVTERIQNGIKFSTHMVCVVSEHTVKSYWVPFEVGYGYETIKLGILTLKGIDDSSLPDYMKTTRVIRGTLSLNTFISELLGENRSVLESREVILPHTKSAHPLDGVLDWRK